MKLFIKNMVCNRCIQAVKVELEKHNIHPIIITLGEAELNEQDLSPNQIADISNGLKNAGFELIDDKKSRITEQIKNLVVTLVHHTKEQPIQKYSELITQKLHHDYSYLSKLFSEVEGTTIEQYIINQRVEKIKEYIMYNELSLSEIADQMAYSSVAHLSSQFKKVTGITPTQFKNTASHQRKALDEVGK